MVRKKVLVAMSGGVDSSMTAYLLKNQGYELIGVTLRVFKSDKYRNDALSQNIKDASVLSNRLQIPYFVVDVSDEFEQIVINNFISEYQAGRTPNPCALCNHEIKWKYLMKLADEFGCELIATGHYSQINSFNDRYYITKAKDESKDQSFFLWGLNQKELKRTMFPLGQLMKHEIKKLAGEKGYSNLATKQESYNVCFIPDGDYRSFIRINSGSKNNNEVGNFVDESGNIIGNHHGIVNYTIGQRSGLNISGQVGSYVLKISANDNSIVLGKKNSLLSKELFLKDFVFSKYEIIPDELIISAKLNYRSESIPCKIKLENEMIKVLLAEPAYAMSPGQSIAFFEGDDMIGGGVIA